MVAFFIYDLTKEKMPDPDDLVSGNDGSWKCNVYGEPIDYQTKQTQIRIRDNYSIDRPFRIALIYEGDTEDTVIRKIFDALYIDHERDGIFLLNAKGQGNIKKNLSAAIEIVKANATGIFLLLDRDANWSEIINDFTKRDYLRDNMYYVWQKDFESDNFKIDEIVDKVNHILVHKSYHPVETERVSSTVNNSNMSVAKAIADSIWEKKSKNG